MPWSHNVKPFYNINIGMAVIAERVNGSGIVFVNLQIETATLSRPPWFPCLN